MKAIHLKTNHLVTPLGIDGGSLFLSWQCNEGLHQTAYEIVIKGNNETIWESGKNPGSVMHVNTPNNLPELSQSRLRGSWQVRLWDENDKAGDWSVAFFETGLHPEDWRGVFVNPETDSAPTSCSGDYEDAINQFAYAAWQQRQSEKSAPAGIDPSKLAAMKASAAGLDPAKLAAMKVSAAGLDPAKLAAMKSAMGSADTAAGKSAPESYQLHRPASYLRKNFCVKGKVSDNARLYITAKGLYVAWINGKRVGDMVLAPGSFTGNRHLGAQTYDISSLLFEGENEILIALGDGWQRSTSGVDGDRNLFGDTISVLFQLEMDGDVICFSDDRMMATQFGPIRQNDLQQGEVYDARLEEVQNHTSLWHGVITENVSLPIEGMNTLPIREHETFPAVLLHTPNGETVLDFGQNIAGYIEINIAAHDGQRILLSCGETLDENGNFTQENFQDRKRHKEGGTAQVLELICREGENHWKPSFTIMGFRYARVETDLPITGAEFTAHAVYSDMAVTGNFTCGNTYVNQLVCNSVWSQKGNFCDIPTDCPTRERAGWTGDMGVFIETGLTLMDCYPVAAKWLSECRLNQYPDGRMANIAPPNSRPGFMTPMLCMSAGWGDASILVPYALYQRTGDLRILSDNYDMMTRWYAFLLGRAQQTTPEQQAGDYAQYTVLSGMDYGEWCEPGVTPMQAMANPRKSVGTAYLAYSGRLLAEIADILGKTEDAAAYRDTSEKAVKAYRTAFTQDGVITSDRQCEYVRPIAFGLLSESENQAAADTLNQMVTDNGYHLNTGFLSTPFLCYVLADYGHADTAYRLLLQEDAPGWLYEVKKGATTVWETWTGIDESGVPHDSLNHYSYGAICGWLFGGVCGIQLKGDRLTIAPTPDPSLGHAEASYDSPVGHIESSWHYDESGTVHYEFVIPSNVTANVQLPDERELVLEAGRHRF